MPPTTDDCCDWCYGPLTSSDLESPLGQALGSVDGAACSACVARGEVLRPPDSLYARDVELSGSQAWELAVFALLASNSAETTLPAEVLRRVAGYT